MEQTVAGRGNMIRSQIQILCFINKLLKDCPNGCLINLCEWLYWNYVTKKECNSCNFQAGYQHKESNSDTLELHHRLSELN